jgi:hypothetical protein
VETTNQEEKRRFRGKGKRHSGAPRQFWNGPDDSLRTEDLREALRARKTLDEPGTSGPPPAGVLWVNIFFLRRWAALPGFPPTQGLPEILLSNGTDRSEADASREGKGTTRLSPEPPLRLVFLGVAPSPGPNRGSVPPITPVTSPGWNSTRPSVETRRLSLGGGDRGPAYSIRKPK